MNKKTKQIVLIVVWSIVALILLSVLIFALMGGFSYLRNSISSISQKGGNLNTILNKTQNSNEVSSLSVNWSSGNVFIVKNDSSDVEVTQNSRYNVSKATYELSSGELSIKQKHEAFFMFFGSKPSDLTIKLPQKQYTQLKLKITSGRANVSDIQVREARYVMTSGSIYLDNILANTHNLKMSSGTLNINKLEGKDMQIDMTSGNVKAKNMDIENQLDIKLSSGKIIADSQVNAKNLNLDLTSGTVRVSGNIENIKSKLTSGNAFVATNVVPKDVDSKLTSGKMYLTIPHTDEFALNFSKSSGNVGIEGFEPLTTTTNSIIYGDNLNPSIRYNVDLTSGSFVIKKAN